VLFRQMGDRFRKAVLSFADANDIPWIKFEKDQAKLEVMAPHLARQAGTGRILRQDRPNLTAIALWPSGVPARTESSYAARTVSRTSSGTTTLTCTFLGSWRSSRERRTNSAHSRANPRRIRTWRARWPAAVTGKPARPAAGGHGGVTVRQPAGCDRGQVRAKPGNAGPRAARRGRLAPRNDLDAGRESPVCP